ncbi:protein bax [Kushneria phosphatilytica]|uniref:Protein bax n=1 Tax=Kushneria phosphatilytica TaxID=657387 RepID=A0A5C0ZXR0_9GAMM|nr:protein bax [Kushneria phosphatilytica]QEL10778.1 protein bax [Kushneria phosphatilytica]
MSQSSSARVFAAMLFAAALCLFAGVEQSRASEAGMQMPDLREHQAGPERKIAFFSLMIPLIEQQNAEIAQERQWLQNVRHQRRWSVRERHRLSTICERYGLSCPAPAAVNWSQLLAHVDTVPMQLVLIQAVEESGWGTSRFAREGNNLFGIRCFANACGMAQRGSGRRYQAFESVGEAVRAYLDNLNTHRGYEQFRQKRAELRRTHRSVTALALIPELNNYSIRGEAYLAALQSLLQTNAPLIERLRNDSTDSLS